jgi:hypothetical protein
MIISSEIIERTEMKKQIALRIPVLSLLCLGLFFMLGFYKTETASAAVVTVGQNANKASASYFYYNPANANAQVAINNAIAAAAVGASVTAPGVVNIENASKPYEVTSHILGKSNINIIGDTRGGVILKIGKGVSITAYGGPGTTGWGGVDSAAGDGAIINIWTGITNVLIKNMTFDGSCGDYYPCSNDDRGRHRLVLMNLYQASNIVVDNVKFTNGQDNAIWGNSSNTVEIKNSRFDMIGHDFVEGYKIQNLKFHHNIGAMRTNSGVRCSGTGTNCYVYDNEFYTGTGGSSALELQDSFTNVKVYNNYFHDISPYGAIGYGGQNPSGSGHEYYNNLFVNLPYAVSSNVPESAVTHNNIMINCKTNVGKGADTNNIKLVSESGSGYTFEKYGSNKSGDTYWIVKSGTLASAFAGIKIGIDGVAGGSDGTSADPGNNTCNSWTYSDWSACANGQQTRTIASSSPLGCAGGSPILSQSCSGSDSKTANLTAAIIQNTVTTVAKGSLGVQLISVKLTNTGTEDLNVTGVEIPGSYAPINEANTTLYADGVKIGTPTTRLDTRVTFAGLSIKIAKGASVNLALKGDILATNIRTTMTFYIEDTTIVTAKGLVSGAAPKITIGGSSSILTLTSGTVNPASNSLTATIVPNIIKEVEKGATNVQLISVDLNNTGTEDINVTGVEIPGSYAPINEADTTLYQGDNKLGIPTTRLDTKVTFAGLNIKIPKGQSVSLNLKGDILATNIRTAMTFYIEENSIVTAKGVVSGTAPKITIGGSSSILTVKAVSGSTAALSAVLIPNTIVSADRGTKGVQLISYKVANIGSENLLVTSVGYVGDFKSDSISNISLYINDKNVGLADSVKDTSALFSTLAFVIAKGESFTFTLKGDVSNSAVAGAKSFVLDRTAGIMSAKGMTSDKDAAVTVNDDKASLTIKDEAGIVDGSIIRAFGDIDVYIVKIAGNKMFKRVILSPSVFRSYGHLKWENVIVVDKSILNAYTNSNLVHVAGDEKVWKLEPSGDSGKKTAVTGTNYDPDSVYEINAVDFASYV